MEIKNFIKIYDQALPWNTLSNLIRFANISKFTETQMEQVMNVKQILI